MLQVDRKEIVEAPVEKVNQFLSQVLADLGWQNVNTEGGVTTGEMIDSDFSHSQNHFTVIITCVSLSEKTELLLSICGSNDGDFLATAIVRTLYHQLVVQRTV